MRINWGLALEVGIAAGLGGIGAAAGFTHTHDWASAHGQHGWLAWADAVVIECMVTMAGFHITHDHRMGNRKAVTLPVVVLVVGFVIQMAAQVAQAEHSVTGWLLAAMPALGFLTVVKLFMRRAALKPPVPPVQATPSAAPVASPVHVEANRVPDAPALTARPSGTTLARLPESVRLAVLESAGTARSEGREITPADITRTVRLPAAMASQLVAELNATAGN